MRTTTLARTIWIPLTAAVLACGPAEEVVEPSNAPPQDALAAAEAIDAEGMRAHIAYLAADELGGRGPGSEGDRMTAEYLVEQLQAIGFAPGAGNGSWLQSFDIVGITSEAPDTWRFDAGDETVELAFWDDYIASSGVQAETSTIDGAELVFVGYGIQAPEYGWDDFDGADVAGKVLVIMNNDPDWDDELFEGNRRLYYGRWTYKYEKAAEMGAVGAIIIHTTPSAGYPFQVVQTSWTGEQFEIPAGDEPRLEIAAWTTEEAMRGLMAAAGRDLDALTESARTSEFTPVPLGITTSLELANQIRTVQTANVVGRLAGGDPELAAEAVVYSAHHDHLGIGKPNDDGDEIYNGARDNASGVAQLLEIGEAFAALAEPPRRTILLAFVAAEEQGLLGSAYYAANPSVPAGRLAVNINLDAGNIWGETDDVTFIGYGKSADLDAVVDRFADWQGREVFGDQFPDRGFFYRSDQVNFARVGVPAIYLDGGSDFRGKPEGWGTEQIEAWEAVHYHQPSDELTDEWDFGGMVQDTRLGFFVGHAFAQADEMPSWNPGDEFEAARLAALSE